MRVKLHGKSIAGVVLAGIVAGCAGQTPYEPEDHPLMGMPSASHDEMENMFELPDKWPDGAPTTAMYNGKEMGRWQPIGRTDNGCIEYQLLPEDTRYIAPDVTHYWHGDMYRTESKGCVPVEAVEHSDINHNGGNNAAAGD
ncbi:hypothetical protein [Vreelandella massiliensis]|uniref:hypothetical protein n=1 Tax=Vreelandella massiliensis TaxID=1816686 RepID=UPI001181A207|nr:hypothetical protein [Halomonas massiliensis]